MVPNFRYIKGIGESKVCNDNVSILIQQEIFLRLPPLWRGVQVWDLYAQCPFHVNMTLHWLIERRVYMPHDLSNIDAKGYNRIIHRLLSIEYGRKIPLAYSRIMPICLSVYRTSHNLTIFGWWTPFKIAISLSILFILVFVSTLSFRINLIATYISAATQRGNTCTPSPAIWPGSGLLHPNFTFPNSPSPRVCPRM